MCAEELTFDCGVQVYYSVVMNVNENKKTEEVLLYNGTYANAESYFNNLIKINKKHNIYSDDVVSIVLKKIIISHYNVDVREVKTISKDNDWNPYSEDEKTFESNFVAG